MNRLASLVLPTAYGIAGFHSVTHQRERKS